MHIHTIVLVCYLILLLLQAGKDSKHSFKSATGDFMDSASV